MYIMNWETIVRKSDLFCGYKLGKRGQQIGEEFSLRYIWTMKRKRKKTFRLSQIYAKCSECSFWLNFSVFHSKLLASICFMLPIGLLFTSWGRTLKQLSVVGFFNAEKQSSQCLSLDGIVTQPTTWTWTTAYVVIVVVSSQCIIRIPGWNSLCTVCKMSKNIAPNCFPPFS